MKTTNTILQLTFASSILLGIQSCTLSSSDSASVKDGITTTGKDLSCHNVYISSGSTKTTRREFVYGERMEIHLDGIEGFKRTGKEVHPGMEIVILNEKGEKIMQNKDLYADFSGKITQTDLDLFATVSIARPIVEKGSYKAKIHVWDKTGKGTFDVEFPFSVIENKSLKTTVTSGVSYDRIYLFDQQGDSSLTTNTIFPGQRAHIIIEGLKGFAEKESKCQVGLSLKVIDVGNQVIFDNADLIGDQLIDPKDLADQASANFVLDNGEYYNPIIVKLRLYDKIGGSELNSTFKVHLK